MAANTNRIIWIDYVKAFAIMIDIMLHIGIPDPFRTIVRSFIIPIFLYYLVYSILLTNILATTHFGNLKHYDY
jgi:hypothetical protein